MREDVLEDQRDLVRSVEAAGWEVTETELSTYESPWEDEDAPEATVVITARRTYADDEEDADDGDEGSRFRVK